MLLFRELQQLLYIKTLSLFFLVDFFRSLRFSSDYHFGYVWQDAKVSINVLVCISKIQNSLMKYMQQMCI